MSEREEREGEKERERGYKIFTLTLINHTAVNNNIKVDK